MQHLSQNKLLSEDQHGFVNQRACVTNLLETADFLTAHYADKIATDLVLLDFAKAFDKVPHRRLLLKLERYGIRGKLLNWIKAFLSNRKQRVCLGSSSSGWIPVTSSVPQGSVLGPTLFIIYINDLVDVISNRAILYADDTKILSPINGNDDAAALQLDINSIISWTNKWLMKLNIDKCKVMHFGKNNNQHVYTMNDYDTNMPIHLSTTDAERDLGIHITSNLKVSHQCKIAANKANFQLGLLRRSFISRDPTLWRKLYITYIRPHLEYAIAAWNPFLFQDTAVLEKVQERATRIPPALKRLDYRTRCSTLGITTLKQRRVRGDMIQKYKFHHELEKIKWFRSPVTRRQRASRQGIDRGLLVREIVKNCEERFHFFNNRVPNYWNVLPDTLINTLPIESFKAGLDRFLPTLRQWVNL
jgi:hypothetical protein